ncbi:MAG: glycosyltransferase [Thermodesulfobacteriota bacterium]
MSTEYVYVPPGLPAELGQLDLEEVCAHLQNYLGNFLLDPAVASVYLNRMATAPDLESASPATIRTLAYLSWKYAQFEPFEKNGLGIALNFREDAALAARLQFLRKMESNQEQMEMADRLMATGRDKEAERRLTQLLAAKPGMLPAADRLLRMDMYLGKGPGAWLRHVRPPAPLLPAWNQRLFNAYAKANDVENALALWPRLDEKSLDETTLNLAAEVFNNSGERARAARLYARSLALDPAQVPVRLRLDEIASPFVPDHSLPGRKMVNIYLYTFNKADMLGRTLASLAACDIGPARIKVLLNGCTDHSRSVAEAARAKFPDNPFEIIELPVNIGAPAARNWLIAQPDTKTADYTAFLDDDVDLQPDWLAHFLSVAEAAPRPGVVGCKVVFPGTPVRYQYLFRTISVAKPHLIRLSLVTPNVSYDNGLYNVVRSTASVMGCCHLLSREALAAVPSFDIRFSPSQMDDIAHDLDIRLAGFSIHYTGLVSCVHHQNSGVNFISREDVAKQGNVLGNDLKFTFRFMDRLDQLRGLMNAPPDAARSAA